jgi:hypothetical protein
MSSYSFVYEESEIPEGMTIAEWRAARRRPAPRRRGRLRRALRVVGG